MKNKNFYNVVNKTKLIDVFKKNKVMMNTYFGQLPSTTGLYLDFTKQDTYNKLVNAAPWVASEPHDDFTIYRRDANFNQELTSEGTKLFTTGTASTDRYGLVTTAGPGLGNKVMYEIVFTSVWNGQPVESKERQLNTWFIGNNPTDTDHTRVKINALNGSSTLSIDTITVEGSSTRTEVVEVPFTYGLTKTMKLIWDTDNHTLELILDGNSVGTYPFYGDRVGYVNLSGTSQAAYKPNSYIGIKSIQIKGVE